MGNDISGRTIVIKKMETDDEIKGKAYVHWKCWHETYTGLMDQGCLDAQTLGKCEEISFRWRENLLVAKDGDRVIGFIGCGKSTDTDGCGEIFALYVLPEYQGIGIGSRLLQAGLEQLEEYRRICLWALKENRRAIGFYRKHGFSENGEEKYVRSVGASGIKMVLEK